ncbi:MAG: hypothetical protein K940chlam7_01132 [Chlamydiae bacterium]|nr:hypothetical protein [Chlamydiota bacterium]
MDNLDWLMQWFKSQCDGDWEHEYGITLGTLDNPGWRLSISLGQTPLDKQVFDDISIERYKR